MEITMTKLKQSHHGVMTQKCCKAYWQPVTPIITAKALHLFA
jgi:hypothetical protein